MTNESHNCDKAHYLRFPDYISLVVIIYLMFVQIWYCNLIQCLIGMIKLCVIDRP